MRKLLFLSLAFLGLGLAQPVLAAGSLTVTYSDFGFPIRGKKVVVAWTGDASDGSVPATVISLGGLVAKVVTNPGGTAPTDNYDIACGDPSDSTLDIFTAALNNRDTTTTEQAYPVVTWATMPVYATTCTLGVTNNSVGSATGTIEFYVLYP